MLPLVARVRAILLEFDFGHAKSCSFGVPKNERGCAFPVHSLKQFIYRNLRAVFLRSRSRRFAFGRLGRSEIAVQRRVGGVENEVAIAAFGKVPLDLAFDRRGQLSL